jgi:hypothetical protein
MKSTKKKGFMTPERKKRLRVGIIYYTIHIIFINWVMIIFIQINTYFCPQKGLQLDQKHSAYYLMSFYFHL